MSARGRDWRDDAACATGVDPEMFFPVAQVGPVYEAQVAAAKAVCAGCSVVADCLADALVGIPHGIAGGLTEQERGDLTRGDRSAAIATPDIEVGGRAA